MKKLEAFAIGILVVFPLAILAQDEGYYDRSYARMSYVKGDVSVQRASDQGFEQGEVNLPLVQGDKLGTRDGRAEIQFGKSNYLRIDANTQLDFKGLPQRDGDATSLHLLAGRIYLRVAFLDREKAFEIHTPDASFYVLDQGLYRFEVSQNRETEVFVFDGSLEAAGQEGSVQVGRNERLTAVNGDLRSPSSDYVVTRDDFAEWNADRDELHKPRASTRYLPEEINEYQDELDANGHWTYERPYGYVWVPYISDSGWRPYYNGRWVWYPIIGWTWVSYESWGWCAYHYGRWHWRLGLGWYWIPTHHWGPAWVHWWSDYDYCGWSPLGWYNSPIVVINNYFYDRYDHRDYPLNSRALTVVRRNQLQSRQIARDALSADRIKLVNKVSLRAQQPDIKPVVDRAGLDQRIGAKNLARQDIRDVQKSFTPGGIRLDRSRLINDVRNKGAVDSFDKTAIRERGLNASPRDIRGSGQTGTPRLLNKEGFKTYPSRTSPSSLRSDLSQRRDEQSSTPGRYAPRELNTDRSPRTYESREPRASSDALGGLLRTFRSRISESATRSGERDSIDLTSPRTRSSNDVERRPEIRSNRDSDGPSYSRSYSSTSRESSSSSSSNRPSYSPRARESSPSSSSSRSSYSPSSSSSGSRSYSSPSRSSGSSSRSVSSGRIHKK
ncbi:MAG: FecR domain-containing protein [Candidatus Aminicenantes bacterium]|nr:FecR domain-containing protein [Candidatus Aminicenantes bacterium]